MNGILLIDKEQGWTSSDVVVKLKGILHERRIGHAGTLDPMATGLLTVFVGRATRAVSFADGSSKRYLAALRLGIETDTQDITGTAVNTAAVSATEQDLRRVFPDFLGEQMQVPPMYSAVRVKGKHLYEIARKGVEVERAARPITIHELELLGRQGDDYLLSITCSKGTYIRTLCHDIGRALGCGACMSALRRTQVGTFSVEDALTIAEVRKLAEEGKIEERLSPTDSLFTDRPAYIADAEAERRIRCGAPFPASLRDGEYRVYSASGDFLMLGRMEKGSMHTVKSFFEV